MTNDDILWKGLRQGNEEMFLALYKRYYHSLFFLGLREIRDAQLVRDTIQQLFLYLWEKRFSIDKAKNVRSYLITSFLRKLTNDWKKSERVNNLQVVWNNYAEDPQPNPEENLIRKDEQGHLFRLLIDHINELPSRQKELIILKFYEGLSYDEIVERTGLSHRTVYNKIHEALKKLRLDISTAPHTHSAALMTLVALMLSAAPSTL